MEKYQYSLTEKALMEHSAIPFAVYQFVDKRVVTLVLSEGFLKLFDLKRDEGYFLMDNDLYRDAHPEDTARIENEAFRFAVEGGDYNVVFRSKIKDKWHIIHARGEHIYPEPNVCLAVIWYTNEGEYVPEAEENESVLHRPHSRSLIEEALGSKIYFDNLTGLPNMTGFLEIADARRKTMWLQESRPAIVFFNLNGMKYYNRKFGFNEGDHLLRRFANSLASHFGKENCSRFGIDFFAVIAPAENIETTVQDVFREVSRIGKGSEMSARAGIALDQKDVELSSVCDRAKYACDVNRGAHYSCYKYFSESMLADVEKRQYVIDNIDRAIKEKWISVYYQPIIRTANGRVCNEEALARWLDPVNGFMVPSDFISALEDVKLIYKLDLCVLDQVLAKMHLQASKGLNVVPISINFSRTDFDVCDLVEEIRRRVDISGIARNKIVIEITESVVGSDFEFIKMQIDRFKALGFPVWMDDFGSGYSSLDVLQSTHFDLIKFDMRFMQRFDDGDDSKIILTELMKMAIGLGLDTLVEGVERQEQLEFLREIGCTMVQGYYYTKPISMDSILERYEKGIQIGFENPDETDYYNAIGRINLYDMSVLSLDDRESFRNYFNTLPVVVLESDKETLRVTRCNRSFREFTDLMGWNVPTGKIFDYKTQTDRPGFAFLNIVQRCAVDGNRAIIDDMMPNRSIVHAFLRRIAVNPVTGMSAIVIAVLGVMENEKPKSAVTYAQIAKALSSDYFNLFYVDMVTEDFIQYNNVDGFAGSIDVERHGKNFFAEARKDALRILYEPDQEMFLLAFTKENVLAALADHDAFILTYRQMYHGKPVYVNMKAVRMSENSDYVIIGVNNVDAQVKQQEALEHAEREQLAYSRITALSGDLICVYVIDPETDHYQEYMVSSAYETLGMAKEGSSFFDKCHAEAESRIYKGDLERFRALFSREKVLKAIEENGLYGLRYRLMIGGKPEFVSLKAALVQEADGPRLIIGIHNIDARLKRDQEYAAAAADAKAAAPGPAGGKRGSA